MSRRLAVLIAGSCMLSAPVFADDEVPPVIGGKTYVQHQILAAKARHPGVLSIVVEGRRDGDTAPVVLGSTVDSAAVLKPVARPAPDHGDAVAGAAYVVHRPFLSSTGHALGTITVAFRRRPGAPTAPLAATADAIARDLARATLSAKNAADPYPYDPAWGPGTYAQALTNRTVARHPELLVMMIHATPPGHAKNLIIGSNIGRFGKIADEDDARVIDKGSTNLEIAGEGNDRFETEVPLNQADGTRIGALGLVFHYHGEDKEAMHRRGLAIRDEVAAQIPSNAALFRPAR